MAEHQIRNILITGASSEIGQAIVYELKDKSDYRILLASRTKVKAFYSLGNHYSYLHGIDFTESKNLETLKHAAENYFNGPFGIIHSVGKFWRHKPFIRTEFSEIHDMYKSHILTLCGVLHTLLPLMIKLGGGKVVAFSCNSVSYNYPDMAPFTSAKAAVESLIKCIANEYSEFGISAFALALPTIKTKAVLLEKTAGDHENYITPKYLAKFILENVLDMSIVANGNVIKLFKYSKTFYQNGYFERNPRLPSDEIEVKERINE